MVFVVVVVSSAGILTVQNFPGLSSPSEFKDGSSEVSEPPEHSRSSGPPQVPDVSTSDGTNPSGLPPVDGVADAIPVGAVPSGLPPVGGVPDSVSIGALPRGVPPSWWSARRLASAGRRAGLESALLPGVGGIQPLLSQLPAPPVLYPSLCHSFGSTGETKSPAFSHKTH